MRFGVIANFECDRLLRSALSRTHEEEEDDERDEGKCMMGRFGLCV